MVKRLPLALPPVAWHNAPKQRSDAMQHTTRLRKKVARLDQLLEQTYGKRRLRKRGNPLDELILTILSQNTSDRNSHRAYEAMRAAFPTWEDVLDAPRPKLEAALRPGGLARTKSARIQAILRSIAAHGPLNLDHLHDLPDAEVERTLLGYDGVGYKTARCVLLFALGRDAFPVDTHIHRVLTRLGVVPEGASADKAHEIVPPLIPKGRCYPFHVNLIAHGRAVCHPRNPECSTCPLRRLCAYAKRPPSAPSPE